MRLFCLFLSFLAFVGTPAFAQSQNAELDAAIERLTEAYGGERLISLQSISLASNRRLAWPGQGQTATFVEYEKDRLRKHFDLIRKHGSVERWTAQNGNVYHNRYVVTDSGATMIDYFEMTATPSERGGYWQWFSGDYRSSDTLMAHLLATAPPEGVEHVGTEYFRGHMNDKIAVTVAPDTPSATIYVSQKDGLIRRLTMERDIGEVNILFSEHRAVDGVSFGSETHIYVDDTMTEYFDEFTLTVNAELGDVIALEDGLDAPAERVELSEMTVDELAPDAFVVGREDYGLFVVADGGVIAVNAYAGLKNRYEALLAHLGRDLPLADVIATHHHSDHIDALEEAVELGATLHLTEHTQAFLTEQRDDTGDWRIEVLTAEDTIGPLSVYVRPTSHAAQNAFVYHAGSKALFQDDHYHGLIAEGATRVQPSAVEMYEIVSGFGLDIDYLLSGHARKAERWSVFAEAATRPGSADPCPTQRAICM